MCVILRCTAHVLTRLLVAVTVAAAQGKLPVLMALLLAPVATLVAQGTPTRLRLDSIVAPSADFNRLARLVAIDSLSALVLDQGAQRIFMVKVGASAPRAIGRTGDGPGEYRRPVGLVVTGDSVWIADWSPQRESVLQIRSGTGRTVGRKLTAIQSSPGSVVYPLAPGAGANAFYGSLWFGSGVDGPKTLPLWRVSQSGSGAVEISAARRPANAGIVVRLGTEVSAFPNPFAVSDFYVPGQHGEGALLVSNKMVSGNNSAAITVQRIDSTGSLGPVYTVHLSPQTVSSQLAERVIAELLEKYVRRPNHADSLEFQRQVHEAIGPSLQWPAAQFGIWAADGSVWLQRFGPGTDQLWDRIELPQSSVRSVAMPPGCAFRDAVRGWIWLTCIEAEIPTIRRARFVK